MTQPAVAVYWDTSAIVSAVFADVHSAAATAAAAQPGIHLISSLAWTETHATIAQIERERALATVFVEAAREALDTGPWRPVNVVPDWQSVRRLSAKWSLSGADLWHLAAAMELRNDFPELVLLSYDSKLIGAANGEGVAVAASQYGGGQVT